MADRYYRGQGKVYVAERSTAGVPLGFRWIGNCPILRTRSQTNKIDHQESYTGRSLTDLVIETGQKVMLTTQLEFFDQENLALALYGTTLDQATLTVTSEALIGYRGKSTPVRHINLSAFTSLTNDDATTTYVSGTDYTVDLKTGLISIPATGTAITEGQALRANYATAGYEKTATFSRANRNIWIRFEGLNTAENDSPVVLDFYKVRLEPAASIDWIGNELSSLELEGEVLYDALQPDGDRFYRERQLVAA
ncbi:MAG: hypothetical protein HC934_02900 [Acaryochloridaceae cyanobacterium SU_2_1]|nr:hypothetical protein [Acaryochloridaceae cyanobacterium SU_2_1]